MNLIPLQSNSDNEFLTVVDVTIKQFKSWRYTIPLHINSSFTVVAEDVRKNSPHKVEFGKRRKLSSLKGTVTKMSAEEIDKQLKLLRDEWQRDI